MFLWKSMNGYSSSSFHRHRATCISDINMTFHLSSSVHTSFYFKTFQVTWILAPQNVISSSFFLEKLLSLFPSVSPLSHNTVIMSLNSRVSYSKGGWYCKSRKNQTDHINKKKNPTSYLQRVAWSPVDTYSSSCPITSITSTTTICINNCKVTYKKITRIRSSSTSSRTWTL